MTDKITIYGHQASRASRPYWLFREYGMTIGEDFLEVALIMLFRLRI